MKNKLLILFIFMLAVLQANAKPSTVHAILQDSQGQYYVITGFLEKNVELWIGQEGHLTQQAFISVDVYRDGGSLEIMINSDLALLASPRGSSFLETPETQTPLEKVYIYNNKSNNLVSDPEALFARLQANGGGAIQCSSLPFVYVL